MCFLLALSRSRGEEPTQQPVDHRRGAGAHRCGHGHHHHHHCRALPEEQERLQAGHRDEPASEGEGTQQKQAERSEGVGGGWPAAGSVCLFPLGFGDIASTFRNILTSAHFLAGDPLFINLCV